MRISSRCEYACRAMLELAQRGATEDTVTSTSIAERREIPEKYLVHILLQLKRAGLVHSVRGAQGGYRLADSPERISVLRIVEAIDGSVEEQLLGSETTSPEFRGVWRGVSKAIRDQMAAISLQRILDATSADEMYYI